LAEDKPPYEIDLGTVEEAWKLSVLNVIVGLDNLSQYRFPPSSSSFVMRK
jgi:hypothetical protein